MPYVEPALLARERERGKASVLIYDQEGGGVTKDQENGLPNFDNANYPDEPLPHEQRFKRQRDTHGASKPSHEPVFNSYALSQRKEL